MSTIAKVFVVLNLVLAVAFLGASATFLGYVDSYKRQFDAEVVRHRTTTEQKDAKIASLESDNRGLTTRMTETTTARDRATELEGRTSTNLAELKTRYDQLAAAHTRTTAALTVANDTIRGLTELKDQLQKDRGTMSDALRAANEERGAAVKAANQSALELDNARAQIQELEQKLSTCEEARQRLEFAQTTAIQGGGTGGPGPAQPPQSGKILAADPRNNIVVISLGSEDGVKVGFRYVVSRGAGYVGTVEVTSTEAKQSAARSIRDLQKSEMRTGDDIMSR
jgi:hypothetical protein